MLYFLFFIIILYFIYLDGLIITKNVVKTHYKKWKGLNELVSTRHKTTILIFWFSLKIICHSLYLSFLQYMNNSVKKIDRKTYEISYIINGKIYKMIVIPDRGPCPVLQVTDEKHNDITDIILPYLGPSNNWHTRKFCPNFFKRKSLTLELSNGEEKTFNEQDYILL
jgi:hypothetical protein